MNLEDKIVSAVGAALVAGAIGGGAAVANAQPTPVPPPPPPRTDGGGGPGTRGQRRMRRGSRHGQHSGGRPERSGGAGRLRAPRTARSLRMLL
jgi:hypothetical protein